MPEGHIAAPEARNTSACLRRRVGADDFAQPSAPSGALRMRHTPCGCCPSPAHGVCGGPHPEDAEDILRLHRSAVFCGDTATVAPRAFVLASSISLAPPQAAGLVHCAARPLQTANAVLVCCLVPFLSCQKKVCKKEALDAFYSAYARKNNSFRCAYFRYTVRNPNALTGDRQIGFPERTANFTSRSVCAR